MVDNRRPAAEGALDAEVLIKEARRRTRRRRWGWAAGLAAVGLAGALVLGYSVGGGGGRGTPDHAPKGAGGAGSAGTPPPARAAPRSSLADAGATPAGWAPVEFGALQLSVPGSWRATTRTPCAGDRTTGLVYLGRPLVYRVATCTGAGHAPPPPSVVRVRSGSVGRVIDVRSETVHGIAVRLGRRPSTQTDVAQALGMTVTAHGPTANAVLRTITHSPLSVVLGSHSEPTPRGWRHVTFAGLRFSVPQTWPVERSAWFATCGSVAPFPSTLRLSTGMKTFTGTCSLKPGKTTVAAHVATPGLGVSSGPAVWPYPRATQTCRSHDGLRVCVIGQHRATGGFLTAEVLVPGRSGFDLVQIGLDGSGAQALAIYDSMRPAG